MSSSDQSSDEYPEDLRSKPSKLSVCNVNKRIKRQEVKIAETQCQVKQLENDTSKKDKLINDLEGQLRMTRTSAQSLRQKLCHSMESAQTKEDTIQELSSKFDLLEYQFSSRFDELEQKMDALSIEVKVARQERDEHADRLKEIECGAICTKHGQKFVDGVKQLALQKLQEKRLKEKEKITENIMVYGLWLTEVQMVEGLEKLQTNADKLKALKCQLDFRKKVLEQKGPKEVFFLTKNRKKLTVKEVVKNLRTLLPSSSLATASEESLPLNPFIASQESLVGKRICHRWKDSDGIEKWHFGNILSLVPGTDDWLNVQYDGEDVILSLNLFLDIEKGDLNIIG